jgi:hypothetical protein
MVQLAEKSTSSGPGFHEFTDQRLEEKPCP